MIVLAAVAALCSFGAAGADKVVNVSPIESVQAKLFDASGKEVADMPYQSSIMNFNVKRNKTASDEVWHLKFVKILDDMKFQVGVDGIPLVSTDPNAVIGKK